MILEVKFTKIGQKIKYELPVQMWCERMETYIPNSRTLELNDGVYKTWLGDKKTIDKLFKKTNTIYKLVELSLVYDKCDKPMPLNTLAPKKQ